jgi:hypothetical protein
MQIMKLRIAAKPLTDGSLVFDVVVSEQGNGSNGMRFECMSHGDAEEFMRGLVQLIEMHTTH